MWMAHGKEEVEWNRLAAAMVNARVAMSTEQNISVADLVPKRFHPPEPELSEEQKQRLIQRNWVIWAQAMAATMGSKQQV